MNLSVDEPLAHAGKISCDYRDQLHVVTFAAGLANDPGLRLFHRSFIDKLPRASLTILSPDLPLDWGKGTRTTVHRAAVGPGNFVLTRWQAIAAYLEDPKQISFDAHVMLIDSRDVVFNADPTPEVTRFLSSQSAIAFFSEHQNTGDHAWCRGQAALLEKFSAEKHALDRPEVNGGIIIGRAGVLADFAREMAWTMALFTSTGLSDQPVINRWVRRHGAHVIDDPEFYCHGELIVQKRWIGPVPTDCTVLHQYDRIPELKKHYAARYPQSPEEFGKELVVSHFNEALLWCDSWLPEFPRRIYSKGDKPPGGAIALPNVGFEAHTWLQHFAHHYDALPKVTICMQGHPGAHFQREEKKVKAALLAIDPDNFSFLPIAGSGHDAIQTRDGGPNHPGLGPDLDRLWRALLGCPPPERWHCFYGGQFAVHRDVVRRRPREWYARAAELVKSKAEACVLERMWGHVFA
jgi:hypothetical protein